MEGIRLRMVIKLFSLSNLEGNFGPDGSISLSPLVLPPSSTTTTTTRTAHNTQHTTHNTQHTETETEKEDKTQVLRTICTSDISHDVRLKKPLDLPQWFHTCVYICRHESKTPQHSKWNCLGANRSQHRNMYGHIVCD